MADFLSRMAERVLDSTASLEPLIGSIFASASTDIGNHPYDSARDDEGSPSVLDRPFHIQPSEGRSGRLLGNAPAVPPETLTPVESDPLKRGGPVPSRATADQDDNTELTPPASPVRSRRPSGLQSQTEKPPPRAMPLVARSRSDLGEGSRLQPQPTLEVDVSLLEPRIRSSPSSLAERSTQASGSGDTVTPRLHESLLQLHRPSASGSAHPSADRRADAPKSPPSPPTIRVTIGRIDVRAIMAPSPPPPRTELPKPGPDLTLDEYLRQRNGGRR